MSSAFKNQMQCDVKKIFLNVDEFSDMHTFDGKAMPSMVDENEETERAIKYVGYGDNVYKRRLLVYVSEEDYGALPVIGAVLNFDGKKFVVADATSEMGIHTITLEANTSGYNSSRR